MLLTSTTLARAPTSPALHYVLNDLYCVQMMNNRLRGGYHLGSTRGRKIKTSTKGINFFILNFIIFRRKERPQGHSLRSLFEGLQPSSTLSTALTNEQARYVRLVRLHALLTTNHEH